MRQVFRPGSRVSAVAVAIGMSLAAAGVRHVCLAYLGLQAPLLIVHVAAIAVVAQYLGATPGLISTAASFALLFWQLDPNPRPLAVVVFLAVGVALSIFGGRRLRAEQALKRANEGLALKAEVARMGTFEWFIPEGRTTWSPEIQEMYGRHADRFEEWKTFIHRDDLEAIVARLDAATREQRRTFDTTFRIQRPDGRVVWIHSRGKFDYDATGQPVYMFGVNMDVTELKQAEEALRRTNSQLEAILDSVPEPMTVTDSAGNVLRTNASFRNSILHLVATDDGRGRVQMCADDGRQLPPRDWPINRVRRGERISGEDLVVTIDGVRSHRRFSGAPVYDEHGNLINAVVTFFDITDQKRTAQELQRANETMALAFEASDSGGWAWNVQTGDLFWTASYYRFLGVDPGVKPTPELFYSRVHPDDVEEVRKSIADALDGRITEFRTEFRIRNDAGVRWFERRGRVIRNSEGKPIHLVGISTDITERKILRGLLPTCAQCKKIRDESNHWQPLETYISEHSEARFSHGLCPECANAWMQAEGLEERAG